MRKKFMYVVNPISGGDNKEDITAAVMAFAAASDIDLVSFETSGTDADMDLYELYRQHRPDRVIIAGGDGTIKFVAEQLENENVVLGIIPAGSANGLSVDLELPKDREGQLQTAFWGHAAALDMICINGKKSLHLSDIGLNAELIRNYENSTIRGKLGYAIQAVHTLIDEETPFRVTITANGGVVETEAKMVVIANSKKYGTGVTINPGGLMDDGLFEIVILRNFTVGVFGKIVMGNIPLDTGDVEIITTAKASVKTNTPVHFQIDGEYCGEESSLDIYILHQQMMVAVPVTFVRSNTIV